MTEETIIQPDAVPEETRALPEESVEETTGSMSAALERGAQAGAQAAASVLPALGSLMTRTVYGTCYYTAFGATFAALTVAGLVPKGGALERAFHDGSEAARKSFREEETETAALPPVIEEAAETPATA